MILVIDIGTSSVRTIVYDNNGKVQNFHQYQFDLDIKDEITIELDANIVIDKVNKGLKSIATYLKTNSIKLDAISLTAQRSSVIPVNDKCETLRNAIMWQDTRNRYLVERFQENSDQIFNICGMKIATTFSATKMLLLKEQYNDIYEKAYKLIGFQEFVLHYLTNIFATDTSIASRTMLFDLKTNKFSKELINLFGIDENKLCKIVEVGTIVGNATNEIKKVLEIDYDIPVVTAGGDQQCAALGMGLVKGGNIVSNSGTGSYIIGLSDKPIFDSKKRINCNVSAIPNKYILEGTVLGAGKVIDWFNNEFYNGDFQEFTNACLNSNAGSNGVIVCPSFLGKGSPVWNPLVRGGIYNLGINVQKSDFARAVLEGVGNELAGSIESIEELLGTVVKNVTVAGGVCKNVVFNQIQADMLNKEVNKREVEEATSMGAFISGYKAIYKEKSYDEIVDNIYKNSKMDIYYPIVENIEIYNKVNELRKKYENIY